MAHVRRRQKQRAAPLIRLEEDDVPNKRRSMALLKYAAKPPQSMRKTRAHTRDLVETLSKDHSSPTHEFFADFSAFGNNNNLAEAVAVAGSSAPSSATASSESFADFGSPAAVRSQEPPRTRRTPRKERTRRPQSIPESDVSFATDWPAPTKLEQHVRRSAAPASSVVSEASSTNSTRRRRRKHQAPSVSSTTTTTTASESGGFTFDAFGLDAQDFSKVADMSDEFGEFAVDNDTTTTASQSPTPPPRNVVQVYDHHHHSMEEPPETDSEEEMDQQMALEFSEASFRSDGAVDDFALEQRAAQITQAMLQNGPSRRTAASLEQRSAVSPQRPLAAAPSLAPRPVAAASPQRTPAVESYQRPAAPVASPRRTPAVESYQRPSAAVSPQRVATESHQRSSNRSDQRTPAVSSPRRSGYTSQTTPASAQQQTSPRRTFHTSPAPPASQSPQRPSPKPLQQSQPQQPRRFEVKKAASPRVVESSLPEEKKEDDTARGIDDLKAKFEQTAKVQPRPAPQRTKPLAAHHVQNLHAQLGEELLSPEKLSKSPRNITPKARSEGAHRARSEGGAAVRQEHVSQVLKNLSSPDSCAKSDVGASPFGVTLRKTPRAPRLSVDTSAPEEPVVREEPAPRDEQVAQPAPKEEAPKLTYRERRELELQKQQQQESPKQEEETQQRDVRELIRSRIAANKKRLSGESLPPPEEPKEEPVSVGNPIAAAAAAAAASRQERDRSPKPLSPSRLRQTELIIEADDDKSSVSEVVAPSAAVSHMLMLQQLQQKQPDVPESPARSRLSIDTSEHSKGGSKPITPKATMMMLNAFLAGRGGVTSGQTATKDLIDFDQGLSPKATSQPAARAASLKDDPTYERYFKMLKVGMPMEVVKHAMIRDGLDPAVMDGDTEKPSGGVALKDDPTYQKYFKMLKVGMPMEAVKHAMQRDGLDSTIMDQDHSLPAKQAGKASTEAPKEQDSHRRARLHWKTVRKVTSNSLWAQIDADQALDNLVIDEDEFQELFQAEKGEAAAPKASAAKSEKRGVSVRVIDPKRANNGGIILARLKMSHDDMADAVDRINENALTAEQIENIIEYLPTKEERRALESYMLGGGQDAGEKFESLCECEKFMVSMMTVRHAKQKVRALLFRLQFETCIQDIQQDTLTVEAACDELMHSQRLKKLMGYILTFGNRLNTAGNGKRKAGAFTLDSLLKLNQAKAFDKKTTFLQYIVQIVLRNDEDLAHFKDEIPTVFKGDKIFWDQCLTDLEELENQLENVRRISLHQARQTNKMYRLRKKKNRDDDNEELSEDDMSLTLEEEVEALRASTIGMFTLSAIKYVSAMRDKVEETRAKFTALLEYFGEDKEKIQPHEVFSVIVAFSRDYDKATQQVLANEKRKLREQQKKNKKASGESASRSGKPPVHSPVQRDRPMRASNHQPSMGSILQELKSRPVAASSPEPPRKSQHHRQQSYGDAQPDSPVNVSPSSSVPYRKQFPKVNVDSQPPESAPLGRAPVTPRSKAALRAKARLRMQRSAVSTTAAPRPLPDDASIDAPLSPRSAIRTRRRAEMRQANNTSGRNHGEHSFELD